MLWKLHFEVKSNFKLEISSNALTKLRSENRWKLRTAIINRPMRLQLIICHRKELLSSLSSVKLVLIGNKCYQCKQVCTGTMNEWCKILTIKTRGGVRTQGSRPRTQKKSEAKAKDRHSRGQGQECSRPRPRTALPKKKSSSQKFFKRSPQKNVFKKIFQALHKILTIQKILLSSSRGQANFRGLEASRPRT